MFLFSFYTTGTLLVVLAGFAMSGYLLTLKGKTAATHYLGFYIGTSALVSLGFFAGHLLDHPAGAYHRFITVCASMLGLPFLTYFAFQFPQPWNQKEARITLGIMLAAGLLCAAYFIQAALRSVPVFDFSAHTYTFPGKAAIPGALVLLLMQIYFFATMIRRAVGLRGRERRATLAMAAVFAGFLVPLFALNLLRQSGRIDPAWHQSFFVICGVLGYFGVLNVFIHYTLDRTTFMVKIVGIALLSLLLLLHVVSTLVLRQREELFDILARHEISQMERGRDPSVQVTESTRVYEESPAGRFLTVKATVNGVQRQKTYDYSYYRRFIDQGALPLNVLAVVLSFWILAGFPLFFQATIIRRLKRLVQGLRLVNSGVLDDRITPGVADEIGFLAESFNAMSESIQTNQARLEETVRMRTEELQIALGERDRTLGILERQLTMARDIQLGFVAQNYKPWNSIRFAAEYHPMETVSGDYFDIAREPHQVSLLIADVSGHGIPAALVTMAAKDSFSRHVRTSLSPADVLRQMNRDMLERVKTREYLTAFMMRIDSNNCITFSSAAHPEALHFHRQDGSISTLGMEGTFLGITELDDNAFSNGSAVLEPGDRVFLFTDGVLEAHVEGDAFGGPRLEEIIRQTRTLPLEQSLIEIVSRVKGHTGSSALQDDLTLLAVELAI